MTSETQSHPVPTASAGTMFDDRRSRADRRQSQLPITFPDRRKNVDRRASPGLAGYKGWWTRVNYVVQELHFDSMREEGRLRVL